MNDVTQTGTLHTSVTLRISKYSQTCLQRPPSGLNSCGRCTEVPLCYKNSNWESKMVVFEGRWSLFGGSHELRFDCMSEKIPFIIFMFMLYIYHF
jgi:hypothetical protein